MAKKTRRARLSATQRYMPTPGAPAPEQTAAPMARPAPMPRESSLRGQSALNPLRDEETLAYIRADLKRIGILAGSILAVLIALRILVFH